MSNQAPAAEVTLEGIIGGSAALNDVVGLSDQQIQAIAVPGFQAYEQGRTEEAKTIFHGLTALDSSSYYGYAGLGSIALAAEELDEAVGLLRQAVERNSNDPTVQANLGEALLRQGKVSEATAAFKTALELDPDQKDPGANRARALLQGVAIVLEEAEKLGAAG